MPTDPRGLRSDAPLLDAWLRFQEEAPTPFTIPGHKQRHDLVGDVVAGDVPLYAGLDTMKLSARRPGRRRGAGGAAVGRGSLPFLRRWRDPRQPGARSRPGRHHLCHMDSDASGNGSVVVSRTLHRSMLLGLVLAGLTPVWVRPEVDASTGLPLGVAPEAVAETLRRHPQSRAVLVGDPSYVGTVGDVAALADTAHTHGVPLIVDAAWAAHFGFHPDLPRHPLQLGADAMVVSAHKTLPAWSQAALVLARSDRIDPARLDAGVEATHTTSPAGAILASIDAARALLERDGESLLGEALSAVRAARDRLAGVEGLVILDGPAVDPLKLTLVLPGTGADGIAVEDDLLAAGLPVEAAERDTIVAQVSLADTADLARAPRRRAHRVPGAAPRHATAGRHRCGIPGDPGDRHAAAGRVLRAESTPSPSREAVGRVSVELVAPYPPGIPILAPGEEVTDAVLDALPQGAGRRGAHRVCRRPHAGDPPGRGLRCRSHQSGRSRVAKPLPTTRVGHLQQQSVTPIRRGVNPD